METSLIRRIYNYFRIKSAIRYADKMHEQTRARYYVLKVFNKIRVYDRAHIDFLINEGVLAQRLRKATELQKISIYFTK